jgi:hypothetical protein
MGEHSASLTETKLQPWCAHEGGGGPAEHASFFEVFYLNGRDRPTKGDGGNSRRQSLSVVLQGSLLLRLDLLNACVQRLSERVRSTSNLLEGMGTQRTFNKVLVCDDRSAPPQRNHSSLNANGFALRAVKVLASASKLLKVDFGGD